jgi:hypothetical protein
MVWLDRQFPHTLITPPNPVFDYELRHLHGRRLRELRNHSVKVMTGLLAVALVFWLAFDKLQGRGPVGMSSTAYNITFMAIATSIVLTFIADFSYVLSTIGAVRPYFMSGNWSLLRLTTLNESDILKAKFAAVQIRNWRLVEFECAVRLLAAVFLLVGFLEQILRAPESMADPVNLSMAGIIFVIFGVAYVLEPLWRMRALTAIGLAVSAQIHDATFAVLSGIGSLLAVRLSQVGAVIFTGCGLLQFLDMLTVQLNPYSLRVPFDNSTSEGLFVFLLACLAIAFIIYAFYKVLELAAFHRALRLAFRSE